MVYSPCLMPVTAIFYVDDDESDNKNDEHFLKFSLTILKLKQNSREETEWNKNQQYFSGDENIWCKVWHNASVHLANIKDIVHANLHYVSVVKIRQCFILASLLFEWLVWYQIGISENWNLKRLKFNNTFSLTETKIMTKIDILN